MASAFKSAERATLILGFLFCTVCFGDNPTPDYEGSVKLRDVVVLVLTQPHPYHAERAQAFTLHFTDQLTSLPQEDQPTLLLVHEKWPDMQGLGAWTLFPLMADLSSMYSDKRWLIVCEEETRMDLLQLPAFLHKFDEQKTPFVGRALRDKEPVIIHHFAFIDNASSFAYPDFGAGMALSFSLVKRVADQLAQGTDDKMLFSIDPKHEFAKFMLDHLGERLSPACELCGAKRSNPDCACITWQPMPFPTHCGQAMGKDDLFVAVKTCLQFHKDRVPVVKATWGKETHLIEYYSEVEDPAIPTVNLGVPNTERGHCGKTEAILRHFAKNEKLSTVQWLLIADDDTIINLERLRALLACYKTDQPVHLGERYGFAVSRGYGHDYITGGGGMVFNRAAVDLLVEKFHCPSDDSPDDMMLGRFFLSMNLPVTHTPYMHQARPEDYSEDFLGCQVPVSFHKHWNTDPYAVYKRLTATPTPSPTPQTPTHQEL